MDESRTLWVQKPSRNGRATTARRQQINYAVQKRASGKLARHFKPNRLS
jgi:hypothetical protein